MPKTWTLYGLLAALRVAGSVFLLGMVHPDEFFQSQEVMARHVLPVESPLRRQLFLPWEFELPTPNRSVLFPFLVAGAPYKLLELLGVQPTGFLLLLLPRLLLCGASFLVDAVLYSLVGKLSHNQNQKRTQEKQEKALLLFASSWPTLVFMCRPFSNTFETLVLTLCFAALFLVNPHRRILGGLLHVQTLLLGSLLAVGFFTRFTFPVFFFPLGLELVRKQDELLVNAASKKGYTPSVVRRLFATIGVVVQGLAAFLWWTMFFVAMDTLYYRPELLGNEQNGPVLKRVAENAVIAPLNNLLYNMQYDNLELHGVHPRLTHLTVNMPMLFGPVFLVFLVRFLRYPDRSCFGNACVFFPLVCLSLAPHQEPRFLLPLLVPLHLFTALNGRLGVVHFLTRNRLGVLLWIVFNMVLTLFFGILHQGGIVPLLLSLSSATSVATKHPAEAFSLSWLTSSCHFDEGFLESMSTTQLVFVKTYMPPRFLLAGMPMEPTFQILDLAGKTVNNLPALVRETAKILLVAPASVEITDIIPNNSLTFSRLGGCSPHVSTEDLALDKPFSLELYTLIGPSTSMNASKEAMTSSDS